MAAIKRYNNGWQTIPFGTKVKAYGGTSFSTVNHVYARESGSWKKVWSKSDPVTYLFYASHGQTARRNFNGGFDWKTGTQGGTFSDSNGNILNWSYNSGDDLNAPNFSVMNFKSDSVFASNNANTSLANAVATRPVVKALYLQGYANNNQNNVKYSPEPLWIGVWNTTTNAGSGSADPTSLAQWSSAWAIIPFPGARSEYNNSTLYTQSATATYGDDALQPNEYLANNGTRAGADLVTERDQNGNAYPSPYGKNSLAKAQALVDALKDNKGWILSHTTNTGTGTTTPTSVWTGAFGSNPISGLSRWGTSLFFDKTIYGSMHVTTIAITVELDYV